MQVTRQQNALQAADPDIRQQNMKRIFREIGFVGMLMTTLSDFYFPGVGLPIVTMVGTAVFVCFSLLWPRPNDPVSRIRRRNTTTMAILLLGAYLVSAIWGVALFKTGSIKGALGMGLGTMILVAMLYQEDNVEFRRTVATFYTRLLVIHLVFWAFQAAVSIASGSFLDYILPITGVPTRHGISVEGVETRLDRYSGLYVEPAIYATNIYFFLTARLISSRLRLRFLDILAMATIVGSLSLTGILLVVFLVLLCLVKAVKDWRAALAALGVVAGLAGVAISVSNTDIMAVVVTRLNAPSADPSGRIRTVDALDSYLRLPEAAQLFGIGVGNTDVVDKVSNGMLDILISYGILGVAGIAALFVAMLRQRRVSPLLWVFIIAMLPGGTYFTIQGWWLWVGMMALASPAAVSVAKLEDLVDSCGTRDYGSGNGGSPVDAATTGSLLGQEPI